MSITIELPFGVSDIEKVLAVSEFLDNHDTLLDELKPEVSKFLVREGFFKGPFRKAYQNAFDDLVVSLLRNQLIKHFPSYTPEEIILLTDRDFLKMITDDFYFTQANYLKRNNYDQ